LSTPLFLKEDAREMLKALLQPRLSSLSSSSSSSRHKAILNSPSTAYALEERDILMLSVFGFAKMNLHQQHYELAATSLSKVVNHFGLERFL
jgi:hypothetical protein